MRAKIFWKLLLPYLALLAGVLITGYFYSSRLLRQDSINSVDDELDSLLRLALSSPPRIDDIAQLRSWAASMAHTGARVTVVDGTGRVLADSEHDPDTMENHAGRPEIRQAFAAGEGHSTRYSDTLKRELVYRAARYQPAEGQPAVFRFALPLAQIDASVAELRWKLFVVSLVILVVGSLISLAFSRVFAARIARLKDFSRRVADGDFRPQTIERPRDEISDLAEALNETARRLDATIHSMSSERNRSSAILGSMVEGVAVIDAKERLVFSNRAFSEILNLDSGSSEGRPLIEVVRNSELLGLIRRALRGDKRLQSDIAIGIVQQRSFSATAAPVKPFEAGPGAISVSGAETAEKPSGAVVVLHDVTELRRLERVRQDFVANVSHEFKTPLTAIQGFAETLLAGALNDPNNNRRFLEIIRGHAARLARLTDDLLKLARIEAGKLEVEFRPVKLAELIEGCTETALLKAKRKQLTLETDVPPGMPAVLGDASLLREVLQNLLDNAVQYTPNGGQVRVSAGAAAHEAIVTVSDTGIGIPLVDQERIFERFYRVDAARSREEGGTGLGLSIAKHIVETHGGRLQVESEVGRGSTFSFSIPLAS